MSMKRSRPGNHPVRSGKAVGPEYPAENFRNPWNAGIDAERHSEESKTLNSPTLTTEGPPISLNHSYDKYWGGK